jgi:hypothetical protein
VDRCAAVRFGTSAYCRAMKQSVVALLLLLLLAPATALAEVPNSPDVFNATSLAEAPVTASQQFTRSYDSSAYTFDPAFTTQERDRMGCAAAGGFRFGARTAWHRFTAGGPGSLTFSASTSYDAMLFAFRTTLPPGSKGFGADALVSLDCQDERHGVGDESPLAPIRFAAGDTVLIATASFCGTPSAACNAAAAGGATTLVVTFTADDRDGDGVADGADACPDVPAPTGCPVTAAAPNPDVDGDGVLNERDRCPAVKGTTDDGCLDGDGDGISDGVDRCLTVPGNGRDGCPQPLKATFSNLWTNYARGSRVERLQVKAPRGSRVQWRCKGSGCRRRSAAFTQKRSAESLLRYLEASRILARGAVIEVRVTAPSTLGTYARFKILGHRKNPGRTDRCITAAGRLTSC